MHLPPMVGRLSELNLNHLLALRVLLEEGNVTRAAQRLSLTQSATSHALSTLRQTLGDELLVRSGAGMVPTEKATRLLPELQAALRQLEAAINDERGEFQPAEASGVVTIASVDFVFARFAGELGMLLRRLAPGLELSLVQLGSRDSDSLLENREVDLVIGPSRATASGIWGTDLRTEELGCAVHSGHPLAQKKDAHLTLDEYLAYEHLLISPSQRGRAIVDEALVPLGRTRTIAARVQSFLVAVHMLRDTPWILTAPKSALAVAPGQDLHHLIAPLTLPSIRLSVYTLRSRSSSPRLQWMVQQLRSVMGEVRP